MDNSRNLEFFSEFERNLTSTEDREIFKNLVNRLTERELEVLQQGLQISPAIFAANLLGLAASYQHTQNTNLHISNTRITHNVVTQTNNTRVNLAFLEVKITALISDVEVFVSFQRQFDINLNTVLQSIIRDIANFKFVVKGQFSVQTQFFIEIKDQNRRSIGHLRRILDQLRKLASELSELKTTVNDKVVGPIESINEKVIEIETKIDETIIPDLVTLLTRTAKLLVDVEATFVAVEEGFTEMRFAFTALNAYLAWIIGGVSFEIAGFAGEVKIEMSVIRQQLTNLQKEVTEISKKLKDLPEKVSNEVADNIIGDSYYRWDSTTSYYPTVIFLFKLKGAGGGVAKSQIKLRYPKRGQEITTSDIDRLKFKLLTSAPSGYNYGETRINFVSKTKLAKTIINVSNVDEGKNLIKTLCEILELDFDEKLISVTTPNHRSSITRRSTSIGTWQARPNKNVMGFYSLKKVRLMVNGMKSPLTLWESDNNPIGP